MNTYLLTFGVLFFLSSSEASFEVEKALLTNIFEGYDRRIRPSGANGTGPVVVDIKTYFRSIRNIDDANMAYDTQLIFRQYWNDDRLKYDNKEISYLTLPDTGMIWTPDIFFSNELSGHFHDILKPNAVVLIYPDGKILYSMRISLHLSCPMNLINYPLDSQVCSLILASYGYTNQDIVFRWKAFDPVQISRNLMLPKFSVTKFMTDDCSSNTNTGRYSCIKVDLYLTRNFFYYMVQDYVPTAFMVFLSWLVFWLNPKYTIVRFGIILGILISSIIITTSINNHIPQVSYAKAIDIWIGGCIFFILGCLLELCLVANALSKEEYSPLKNQLTDDGSKNSILVDDEEKLSQVKKIKSAPRRWLNKYSTTAQRMDIFSRVFFPALFGLFNLVYWINYTAAR